MNFLKVKKFDSKLIKICIVQFIYYVTMQENCTNSLCNDFLV